MKKRLKQIAIGVVVAAVLIGVLPLLVYVQPVQQWLVGKVAEVASEETGLNISVQHVDLSFPIDLGVDGVLITSPASNVTPTTANATPQTASTTQDTIADIGRAVVDLQLLPLLKGEVAVEGLTIEDARLNTLSLLSDVQVRGALGRLNIDPSRIHLATGQVDLSHTTIEDADICVMLSDTAAVDTTESGPTPWRITMEALSLRRSQVEVRLPGDSMLIAVGAERMEVGHADINLADNAYHVGQFNWQQGHFVFDQPFEPHTRTINHPNLLDYSHMDISDIHWQIDSLHFLLHDALPPSPSWTLDMAVAHAAMKDVSGLDVRELKGHVNVDDQKAEVPWLVLQTPHSHLSGKAYVDYSIADVATPGQMNIDLQAEMGKTDLLHFIDMDEHSLPEWPITLDASMAGNMNHATFSIRRLAWPTVLEAEGNGTAENLTDGKRLKGQAAVRLTTHNMRPLLNTFGLSPATFNIPAGIMAQGRFSAEGQHFTADIAARHNKSTLRLKGAYDNAANAYEADMDINRLDLSFFLPQSGLSTLNARLDINGRGFDPFATGTHLDANGIISHLRYHQLDLDSISLTANLKEGKAVAELTARNSVVDGQADITATLNRDGKRRQIASELSTSISHLDLYALGITNHPLNIGLTSDVELTSDLADNHRLSGLTENIYLKDSLRTYHPEKVGLLLKATPDTTYARAQSGTLIVKLDAQGHYSKLAERLTTLSDSIGSQLSRRVIDQEGLKRLLPTASLYVSSQQGNPMANMLKAAMNTSFKDLLIDLKASPSSGLNGRMNVIGLNADSTLIDTIAVTLKDKPNHGLTFQGRVANNRQNPQFVFTALMDGLLQEHGLSAGIRFYDRKGDMGLRLGAKAEMEANGMRFHLMPQRPVIGYRVFTLNDDNYLFLQNNMRLQAKVNLLADDGTGVRIYSENQDSTLLQDLTISLHHLDLERLTTSIPFMPRITGLLAGDYHLTMDQKKQISVASDMGVSDMTYEGSPMGTLNTEFVYLQREDDTHAVDGVLIQDGREIANFKGDYRNRKVTDGQEHLDGQLTLLRAPLNLVNGFVPDQIVGLEGFADGSMTVVGTLSEPDVNGEVYVDSAFLVSQPYGVSLRFDNDPVRIQNSKILLENFTMYAYNDTPLNIQGDLDFHDLDNMTMDVRMRTSNFMLINSKRTAKSIAYGKAFVNFMAVMRGPLDRLRMRGRLNVLGTTDLTYLLLDSPLSTDNQMDELVKFTNFSDTTKVIAVKKPQPEGLDMNLTINIEQGARVKCGLNADESNYVDLFGGGELRLIYNSSNNLQLKGRYTLNSGEMKYSLPVIPLKTFNIREGSYVEFTGDAMNPTLNITATERNMASVGEEGMQSRIVAFDCGVMVTHTLSDMGLQFVIDAPDDATVKSEIAAMTKEQQSKLAVTMLTTGMYLPDGNTSGFSMNAALSNFLEKEINNITGNALKTVDLSVGLDNTTDATGNTHTDYSFKFAKRFWNNRLKVQIGGKVSSGNEIQGQKQSFFDNVSMEYRLSPTSNQYVKLFYNQNVYDWLEGYTSEYGGGYIWRRKMDSLLDIFRKTPASSPSGPGRNGSNAFRNSERPIRADSLQNRTDSLQNRTDSLQTPRKP